MYSSILARLRTPTEQQPPSGHDRSVMQDELGHAAFLPCLPGSPLALDLPAIPVDLLFSDKPVTPDLEGP